MKRRGIKYFCTADFPKFIVCKQFRQEVNIFLSNKCVSQKKKYINMHKYRNIEKKSVALLILDLATDLAVQEKRHPVACGQLRGRKIAEDRAGRASRQTGRQRGRERGRGSRHK